MWLKYSIGIPLSSNDASSYQRLSFEIVEPDEKWHFIHRLHGHSPLKAPLVLDRLTWSWVLNDSHLMWLPAEKETLALCSIVLSDLANEQESL